MVWEVHILLDVIHDEAHEAPASSHTQQELNEGSQVVLPRKSCQHGLGTNESADGEEHHWPCKSHFDVPTFGGNSLLHNSQQSLTKKPTRKNGRAFQLTVKSLMGPEGAMAIALLLLYHVIHELLPSHPVRHVAEELANKHGQKGAYHVDAHRDARNFVKFGRQNLLQTNTQVDTCKCCSMSNDTSCGYNAITGVLDEPGAVADANEPSRKKQQSEDQIC
mmetsp:Transcript_48880/g.106489  ORF Transcript_48880/g.106489 Transcript_48880/m.106489 type:complete len:220 (+) Transcript_48880:420-1079(+)